MYLFEWIIIIFKDFLAKQIVIYWFCYNKKYIYIIIPEDLTNGLLSDYRILGMILTTPPPLLTKFGHSILAFLIIVFLAL